MKKFYVYIYLDQRKHGKWIFKDKVFSYQPFYVGKGTNKRDISHLCPYMLNKKTYKSSTIKSIISETGELPIHERIYENLTEAEAISIEKDIIKHFKRKDLFTSGILCNHTDGGDGVVNLSNEIRNNMGKKFQKPVYQYDLDGNFIKKWDSLTSVSNIVETISNISTAIKRNGTCAGFRWSYEDKGKKIEKTIKYQMPIKYKNIHQISIDGGTTVAVHKSALEAATSLNLTNRCARNKITEAVKKGTTAYGYKWKI